MSATAAQALLADRYRLVERIAVGGMGEVWRAEDVLLGRAVAVKVLKAEFVDDPDFRERFRAEARHAGRLAHPGIAAVHDFGESDDSAWLVMELVEGEPLSALLRRERWLSVDRTLDVLAQAAAALHAAHAAGVVHRDVKPGNLLVRHDGVLKVTDFGIASATDGVPLTRTGTVLGTAFYLSPEQAAGASGSPASDLYALGVVAYECLAGDRPFPGTNPVAVALAHLRTAPPPLPPHLPAPMRALVEQALAKDPADRFADAAELSHRAGALRARLDEDACYPSDPPTQVMTLPTEQAALPAPPPGARARSSRRARVAAALLLVLTVVLGARLGARLGGSDTPGPTVPASGSSPSASPPAAPSPATVAVDASSYVGRAAAAVRTELAALGLVPRLAYDGRGTPVGTVSGVEPTGSLALRSEVLLHVVPQPEPQPVQVAPQPKQQGPPADKGPPAGKGGGKGRGNR